MICSTPANLNALFNPKTPSLPSILPKPVSQADSTTSFVFLKFNNETEDAVSMPSSASGLSFLNSSLPIHAQLPPAKIKPLRFNGSLL